jgi:hypothetical protein
MWFKIKINFENERIINDKVIRYCLNLILFIEKMKKCIIKKRFMEKNLNLI